MGSSSGRSPLVTLVLVLLVIVLAPLAIGIVSPMVLVLLGITAERVGVLFLVVGVVMALGGLVTFKDRLLADWREYQAAKVRFSPAWHRAQARRRRGG